MKNIGIGFCIVASIVGVLVVRAARDTTINKEPNGSAWVHPDQLKPGPIRHEALTEKQLERIRHFQAVFSEVDPTPVEKWIEDFRRDANPDREIAIWEGMAKPYEVFTASRNLSLEAKKEVYGVVLMRSGAPEDEVLQHLKLKTLTDQDAKKIMALFTAEPQPIRVVKP